MIQILPCKPEDFHTALDNLVFSFVSGCKNLGIDSPACHIERTIGRLMVDALDIERNEAERHQLNAGKKDAERAQERRAREIHVRDYRLGEDVLVDKCDDAENSRTYRDRDAEVSGDAQRQKAVLHESIECQVNELAKRVSRLAFAPWCSIKFYKCLAKAEPEQEAARDAVVLGELVEFVEYDAIDKAEVRRLRHELRLADRLHDSIESARAHLLQEAALAIAASYAHHDLTTTLPGLYELHNDFGRMVKIRIHENSRVSRGSAQSRARRSFFAEIAREFHDHNARICGGDRCEGLGRPVR